MASADVKPHQLLLLFGLTQLSNTTFANKKIAFKQKEREWKKNKNYEYYINNNNLYSGYIWACNGHNYGIQHTSAVASSRKAIY